MDRKLYDSWVFFWYSLAKLILSLLVLALVTKLCISDARANVNLTILNSNMAAANANRIAIDIRENARKREQEREEKMRLPCLTGRHLASTSMTEREVEVAVYFSDYNKFDIDEKHELMRCFNESRK